VSNLPGRGRNQRINQFVVPEGENIAEFDNYAKAVDCVDQLIRHDFPAAMVAIVGSDLRSVERVNGRLSYASVALRGAITGSWIGLLVAMVMPVSTSASASASTGVPQFGVAAPAAVFIAAGLGMLINVLRFSFSRNRHEFSSRSAVIAGSYQVVVPHPLAQQAKDAMRDHEENCVNHR